MKEFFKSFFSLKVALNVLAAILLLLALVLTAYFSLGSYTNHGEKIEVPNLKKKSLSAAKHDLRKLGLDIQVTDTLYLKNLPADIVMEQMPAAGKKVKSGRIIYVVINAGHSPNKAIPDIVDNSSAREAKAQLQALGFKRVEFQYIAGEKEWVYGLKCNGKDVQKGDIVSVDSKLVIIVGDGIRDLGDSVTVIASPYYFDPDAMQQVNNYSGSGSGGGGSEDGPSYSQEQIEQEIEASVDAEIENLLRQKHSQKYEGGAE